MSIFTCPDCQKPVSTDAIACPSCGKDFSGFSQEEKVRRVARRNRAKAASSLFMIGFSSSVFLLGLLTLLVFWPAGVALILVGIFVMFGSL